MRYTRQNKIIELIGSHEVETQEKLAELLRESGFDVTQATVSRDVKELGIIKALTKAGQYKYTMPEQAVRQTVDSYTKIFKDTVQKVAATGNLVVVKTLTGCANAACEAFDSMEFSDILGSIAGENTFLVICGEPKSAQAVVARFEGLLND